jgi:hypothetical protein
MKKTTRSILIAVFGIYLTISLVWIYKLQTKLKTDEISALEKQSSDQMTIDDYAKEIKTLESIINSDNEFFNGNYQKALELYESLNQSNEFSDKQTELLQIRADKLRELTSTDDTTNAFMFFQQKQLENMQLEKGKLEVQLDSLAHNVTMTEQDLRDKIKRLEKVIADKEKKLEQKDRLQVLSFKSDKGNLIHYLGEVKNGKAEGNGIGIWETGGIYKGNWKNNQRHGEGTYTWKDGHVYVGTFVNDIREGEGTYSWTSGEKYVGEWRNNLRHGQGILYDKDNNVQYDGLWENDKIK